MASPSRAVRPSRRTWLVVPAVLAVGLLASLLGARFTGAVSPPPDGLADAGAFVRWSLPLVRVVHDLAASVALGSLLLAAMMVPGASRDASRATEEPRRGAALEIAALGGFVWAIAGAVGVVLQFAAAAGMPLTHEDFGTALTGSLWSVETLRVGLLSAAAGAVVASAATLARSRAMAVLLAALAALGILVLGLAGHGAGSANHESAVDALAVHLLGASAWVGGLAALVLLRPRLGPALGVVARRYSTLALWCFVALGLSGVLAASTRLGGPAGLATPYGLLVVVKVLVFVLLGTAGWRHRRSTLRQLDAPGSARPFLRLAVGELLLMGLALGVATALTRSAPPVPETVVETAADPSRALALTGFPAPPAPTAGSWLTTWRVDWLLLAVAVLAVALYLAGALGLRRRGDSWPALRSVSWVAGWLVFAWATNGVLGTYGRVAFSWHMTLHMVEGMVVPLFLVLGAPVTLALRALPARRDGTLGPRELVLGLVHSRYLKVVGNPVFAAGFFFLSLVVFYWTGLFGLALTTHPGHLLMTAHFLVAGYLFAWVLVGLDPGPARWSPALRLIVLFATISFHAFFGVAMISSSTLLAPDFFGAIGLPWVPDPLADQRTAGSVAWGLGELPTLVLALVVSVQWARSDRVESIRRDRAADRDGDADLAAYNARLAQLAERDGR
ncbi:MAG TPA: cytochrome c oxidase assembly protein [Intrasporangium sp.]|uniref:cytochrome c oxidase assembly protein n=1 Tax=Intrasporangium sp. TaxID=1925024 RepID=UPI002D77239E|nr:cytochrome c oxidase assembly protein [Intrasporangium sp.]HET7398301.1 cytochrome c oxidase assembly protein [Intrasporangium sp.]